MTIAKWVGVVLAAVSTMALAPAAEAAGTSAPSAPGAPATYEGVDGVDLFWSQPTNVGGGLNGYQVQRAASPDGEFVDLAWVPASAARTYSDPAGPGQTWRYRVVAVNDAGSTPSTVKAATVPSPVAAGPVTALSADGPSWTSGGGGSYFLGAQLAVVDVTPSTFLVRGISDASAPQGARTVGISFGSMAANRRIVPGTYATTSYGNVVTPTLNTGTCGSYSAGSMTVTEASFKADGTPLVFAASYSACGTRGEIRLNGHGTIANVIVSDAKELDFGYVSVPAPNVERTIVFRNAGLVDQPLGTAAIVDSASYLPHPEFAVGADTCSGTTLAPGTSCSVTVAAHPAESGVRLAVLQLTDGTDTGRRRISLTARGIDKPFAPRYVSVQSGFNLVQLTWDPTSGGENAMATGYTVYRGTSADALAPLAEVAASDPSGPMTWTDRDVVAGTTYHYAVTATNAQGTSERSPSGSAAPVVTGTLVASDRWAPPSSDPDAVPDLDIAVLAPNGLQSRLTDDGGDHDTPAVSPDGTAIAYMANTGNAPGDYDLWLLRFGSPAVRLTDDDASVDAHPVFSPDGTAIAFTRIAGETSSVWTVPVAGGAPRRVPGGANDSAPTWSPNGKMLAVATVVERGPATTSAVAVQELDGSRRRIVAGTYDVTGATAAVMPSWSPDGTTLSFVRLAENAIRLATVPFAGGSVSFLTGERMLVLGQRWAPGGERIVFSALSLDSQYTVWSIAPGERFPTALLGSNGDLLVSPAAVESPAPYAQPVVPAVTAVKATLKGTAATLSWTAPAEAVYVVVRRSEAGGEAPASSKDGVLVYEGTGSSVNAAGLTQGQTYRFSVFAMSALGDQGPAVTRTVQPAATPAVPSPNGSVLGVLSARGPKFTASWGKPLPSGQTYEVQVGKRSLDPTTTKWSAVQWDALYAGTATSKVVSASAGTTYYLRARVRDAAGNVTSWSSTAVAPVPYDDRSFRTGGTWSNLTGQSGRFAGTVRTGKSAGASLSLTQDASAFALIVDKCSTCGTVKIYVDGKLKATVDTYAKSTKVRQEIWSTSFSSIGRHTVKVVVVGTAKRPNVRIDGLVVKR
ncbi:MAG: hypothetical protein ACT4QG_04025 [Sporichthyaceae bacterium]